MLLVPIAGACKKTDTNNNGTSVSEDAMVDFRLLPDAEKRLERFVSGNADPFPADVFDIKPPKVEVVKVGKDRFDLRVEHSGTARTAIYSTPPAEVVELEGRTVGVTIVELIVAKGSTKTRRKQVSVVRGNAGAGGDPAKSSWQWKAPEESGDDMQGYDARGPRIGWATAEQLQINPEGTSSQRAEVLIKGTPDYEKAVKENPKLQQSADKRQQEEADRFDRILDSLPRKSK